MVVCLNPAIQSHFPKTIYVSSYLRSTVWRKQIINPWTFPVATGAALWGVPLRTRVTPDTGRGWRSQGGASVHPRGTGVGVCGTRGGGVQR